MWCCDDTHTYKVTTTTVNAKLLAYQEAAAAYTNNSVSECLISDVGQVFGWGGFKRSRNGTEELSLSQIERRQSLNTGVGAVSQMVSLLYLLLKNVVDGNALLTAERVTCKWTATGVPQTEILVLVS